MKGPVARKATLQEALDGIEWFKKQMTKEKASKSSAQQIEFSARLTTDARATPEFGVVCYKKTSQGHWGVDVATEPNSENVDSSSWNTHISFNFSEEAGDEETAYHQALAEQKGLQSKYASKKYLFRVVRYTKSVSETWEVVENGY